MIFEFKNSVETYDDAVSLSCQLTFGHHAFKTKLKCIKVCKKSLFSIALSIRCSQLNVIPVLLHFNEKKCCHKFLTRIAICSVEKTNLTIESTLQPLVVSLRTLWIVLVALIGPQVQVPPILKSNRVTEFKIPSFSCVTPTWLKNGGKGQAELGNKRLSCEKNKKKQYFSYSISQWKSTSSWMVLSKRWKRERESACERERERERKRELIQMLSSTDDQKMNEDGQSKKNGNENSGNRDRTGDARNR